MSYFDLPEWTPSFKKGEPFTAIVPSARKSGKSHLFKCLFRDYFQHQFDLFIVFSETLNTPSGDEFFDLFGHTNSVLFSRFKPDKLTILKRIQQRLMNTKNKQLRTLIIIDDCSSVRDSLPIEEVFVRGRHRETSTIILCQKPSFFNPAMRDNAEVTITFNNKTSQNADFLNKNMLGPHIPREIAPKIADRTAFLMNIPKFHMVIVDTLRDEPGETRGGTLTRLFRYKCE